MATRESDVQPPTGRRQTKSLNRLRMLKLEEKQARKRGDGNGKGADSRVATFLQGSHGEVRGPRKAPGKPLSRDSLSHPPRRRTRGVSSSETAYSSLKVPTGLIPLVPSRISRSSDRRCWLLHHSCPPPRHVDPSCQDIRGSSIHGAGAS